jgi:hypothetical protein
LARTADVLTLLAQFVRTRWGYRFASRAHLLRWQARHIDRFVQRTLPQFAPWQPAGPEALGRKRRRIHCLHKPLPEEGKPA